MTEIRSWWRENIYPPIPGKAITLPANFDFSRFDEPKNRDTDPNLFLRFLKYFARNIKATGGWFFMGIVLSALFKGMCLRM